MLVQPGDRSYSETIYEADPRGRVVAELPLGQQGNALSGLRYPRFHYFTVKAPSLTPGLGTLFSLPELAPRHHLQPRIE